MSIIKIRDKKDCKYDIVSLGEVMVRLDPGSERIHTTRHFRAWEGGGEYNVARGLKRCFGQRGAIVTGMVNNPVGKLLEDLMFQGGLDMSYCKWFDYDGIGRDVRIGLNFTEAGFGCRAAVGCSDRANSAASNLKPGDIDWEKLFGSDGVRWFHTGGIYAGLSETTADVIIEAMQAARKYGTIISYDLNYRPSIWKAIGGQGQAQKVNSKIASLVDVMIGNEEDFSASLGFYIEGLDENISNIEIEGFKKMIKAACEKYPNFQAVATTLRNAITATKNDWSAILYNNGQFYQAAQRPELEIFDRVGGGDSFASGLIYGLMESDDADFAVNCGAAHGALAMTTPGDTTTASLAEVLKVIKGASARVDR